MSGDAKDTVSSGHEATAWKWITAADLASRFSLLVERLKLILLAK
jgi:hypothetical protein